MERKICKIDCCNNLATTSGVINGKRRYINVCYKHLIQSKGENYKKKYREKIRKSVKKYKKRNPHKYYPGLSLKDYLRIRKNPCSLCGWDKFTCDFHRKVTGENGGKYNIENIIVLCPNCHKLVHNNIILI